MHLPHAAYFRRFRLFRNPHTAGVTRLILPPVLRTEERRGDPPVESLSRQASARSPLRSKQAAGFTAFPSGSPAPGLGSGDLPGSGLHGRTGVFLAAGSTRYGPGNGASPHAPRIFRAIPGAGARGGGSKIISFRDQKRIRFPGRLLNDPVRSVRPRGPEEDPEAVCTREPDEGFPYFLREAEAPRRRPPPPGQLDILRSMKRG